MIRSDRGLIAALLVLGSGLPAVIGLIGGTLEIPRLDDWVYRRVALELYQTGILDLHRVTTMMIGQVVIAQPYLWVAGSGPLAFALAGISFAVLAVVSCYVLARQFLPAWRAALATTLLVIFPGYLPYAVSFMTDVPTLALEFSCLAFGAIGLRTRPTNGRWLFAAALMGCLGFSFREFAIAAPASVVVGALCAGPRQLKHWLLAAGVVGACAALYLVKASLSGQGFATPAGGGAISQSMYALSSVSLVLLAAALVAGPRMRQRWKRLDVAIGAEIGLLVVAIRAFQAVATLSMPPVILGVLASQFGVPAPGIAVGARPALFPPVVWGFVGLVALAATVIVPATAAGIAGGFLRRNRSVRGLAQRLGTPVGPLIMFAVAVEVGLTVFGLNAPIFDRYYWPIIPVAAILLLRTPASEAASVAEPELRGQARVGRPAAAILALLGVVSVVFLANSASYDGARWKAATQLAQLGVSPETIDAGYEWVGFHQPDLPLPNDLVSRSTFYEKYWPGRRQCGIVSNVDDPPSGAEHVGTLDYSLLLFGGPHRQLFVFRLTEPDCLST